MRDRSADGADTFAFYCITNNNEANCATGEAQLWVDVTTEGEQVAFTFHNAGPNPSSIADVYFDDGTLLGIANITGSEGVKFSQYAKPENLPGGSTLLPPLSQRKVSRPMRTHQCSGTV